eukprot:scaffold2166_cov63-Attheya_sp.AAC.1
MADFRPSEEELAKWRRNRGIEMVTEVHRDTMNRPHPSRGGARGYPISERLRMLQMWHADLLVPASRALCCSSNYKLDCAGGSMHIDAPSQLLWCSGV